MPGMRKMMITVGLATLVAAPLFAAAQDVVNTRVDGLKHMGAAFKNVNDQLKSGTPQLSVLQLSARQISDAAKAQYGWFPAGSGPQPGVKTRAKPEIWTQPAQFKAAQDGLANQAAAFSKVVATGDTAAIAAQAKQLGGACGACHRQFRADEGH